MNIIESGIRFRSLSNRRNTERIILHHAMAKTCSVYDVNQWHLNNGWAGIGYHFFIRKDGSVYRGRPEYAVGAHAVGSNSDSIGVCFEGDYRTETMPDAQKRSGKELVAYLKNKYGINKVQRHKDVCATDCPGSMFPFNEIAGANGSVSVTTQKSEKTEVVKSGKLDVDGILGSKTCMKAQQVFGTVADGVISNQLIVYKNIMPGIICAEWSNTKRGGSPFVKALQGWCGANQDGYIGPNTIGEMQRKLGTPIDGRISNPSQCIKAFQTWLNKQ